MGVTSFKGDIYWSQCRARSFALKVQPVCCSFPSSTQDFWTGGPSPSATSRTGTRAGRPWSGWSQEMNRGSSWCSNCRTSGWSASRRRSAALRCKDFASTRMTMTAMRTFRSRRQRLSRDIRCRGSRELRVRPVKKQRLYTITFSIIIWQSGKYRWCLSGNKWFHKNRNTTTLGLTLI